METFDLDRMRKELDNMHSELSKYYDGKFYSNNQILLINNIEAKYDDVKDIFTKLKFKLNEKITNFENLLFKKESINENSTGKELVEKYKIEKKLEEMERNIQSDIKSLEIELKSQKKKLDKYSDIPQKEKILKALKEKINYLEHKYKGENKEDDIKNNKNEIKNLEEFLKENEEKERPSQRELYKEEKDKINEYDNRKKEQDKELKEIEGLIKEIKGDAIEQGKRIENMIKKNTQISEHINKTHENTKKQTDRIKDLIKK